MGGKQIGSVTSEVWLLRLETNVLFGRLAIEYTPVDTQVTVQTPTANSAQKFHQRHFGNVFCFLFFFLLNR